MKDSHPSLCNRLLQPLSQQQRLLFRKVYKRLKPIHSIWTRGDPSNLFYPYFRFDGFAAKGVDKVESGGT